MQKIQFPFAINLSKNCISNPVKAKLCRVVHNKVPMVKISDITTIVVNIYFHVVKFPLSMERLERVQKVYQTVIRPIFPSSKKIKSPVVTSSNFLMSLFFSPSK